MKKIVSPNGVGQSKLSAGDWVEVRSKNEILKTLDSDGRLDGMPFMPEMFAFCGKKFRVFKRAHKTCDTVFPVRGRRVDRTVHLDTRCSGQAHGGCDAACLLFWKEAWLKPVGEGSSNVTDRATQAHPASNGNGSSGGCTEADVVAAAQIIDPQGGPTKYVCQATQLPYATAPLNWWDLRQYIEDYTSGNASPWRIFKGLCYVTYFSISQAGIGVGPVMRWFYDKLHWVWRGPKFPRKTGTIPEGQPTPKETLNLQPGELVRVKSQEEILRTLNTATRNRGLWFDAEMVPYCGGTYRVKSRVNQILDEKTGIMQEMKTPCIILDTVVCEARYSDCRMFCPRSIYPYWREIWLERVTPLAPAKQETEQPDAVLRGA